MKDTLLIFLIIICVSCKQKPHSESINSPSQEKSIEIPSADTTVQGIETIDSTHTLKENQNQKINEIEELEKTEKKQPSSIDLSKVKPDYSDPKTTKNPKAKSKKDQKELPKTEIAFRRNFFSFGEIIEGDTIDFQFSFTNIGEHPLVIKSATATCGCTHPSFSFLPVEPGEKGEITGTYVSTGKKGPQNPMVKVVANTFPSESHKLYLDGTVISSKSEKADTSKSN